MLKLLIISFILSKIDYGNSTLVGLPAYYLKQPQHVINAAAEIINNKRKHYHVTPLLHDLHWLRIYQRNYYKISSLVFKSLLGHAPLYLPFTGTAHIPSRRGLRWATRGSLVKSYARRTTLDGRSVDVFVVGPQIWNRHLPPHDYQYWSRRKEGEFKTMWMSTQMCKKIDDKLQMSSRRKGGSQRGQRGVGSLKWAMKMKCVYIMYI